MKNLLIGKHKAKYDENIDWLKSEVKLSKGNFHQILNIQGDLSFLTPWQAKDIADTLWFNGKHQLYTSFHFEETGLWWS